MASLIGFSFDLRSVVANIRYMSRSVCCNRVHDVTSAGRHHRLRGKWYDGGDHQLPRAYEHARVDGDGRWLSE